ncbi:hypothetical protein B0H65DRAFT_537754 [Neurospora tetraspora]|uniref:CNH domain-containing protein n=1 Tax=Neurospora tetraspora TaxID=94610 RepID=A0AAE0JL77_9PEZI|nr:hypothetical protein B0H65DRAFT_537754 [Neurospora tetraspora]
MAPASAASPKPMAAGPYVLRPLLHDVPLSAEGNDEDIKINCVDYLDGNLYVGTSASELLHFFRIPPDPNDPNSTDTFILASRLLPAYSETSGSPNGPKPGVQQILLLPRVGKACILCNWTVTFYSLPELSPVFGTTQVRNCNWIGGVDLNENFDNPGTAVTILLSLNRRIQVVKIGNDARVIRKIDFAGSTLSVRRDSIACVADSRSYALLDVDRQLKIPLMSISSLDDSAPGGQYGQTQNIAGPPENGGHSRSASSATARLAPADFPSHSRSTSLSGLIGNMRGNQRSQGEQEDPVFQQPGSPKASNSPERKPSPASNDADKPLPPPPRDSAASLASQASGTGGISPARIASPKPQPGLVFLKPHIVSPTPEEFLLVTGTGPLDPGIGMFVNLDGDPTRPTVEFERYPREIAVDGGAPDVSSPGASIMGREDEGYVFASMGKEFEDGVHQGLEIQRIDVNVAEDEAEKFWLEVPNKDDSATPAANTPIGIRSLLASEEMQFEEVVKRLCQRRFSPFNGGSATPAVSTKGADSRTRSSMERLAREKELFDRDLGSEEEPLPENWETVRNRENEEFVRVLAKGSSRLAVWTGANIWWAVRNPLLLQLESSLELATSKEQQSNPNSSEQKTQLLGLIKTINNREPKTELEFMTLGYVKQRASIMLVTHFLNSAESPFSDSETRQMEASLLDGDLDARVVLSLIPALRNEIVMGQKGIWVYGGIKSLVEEYIAAEKDKEVTQTVDSLPRLVLDFLRRFLTAWRNKKGFGSISAEIFRTVDASLLLVLLELDKNTPAGKSGEPGSPRKELYELVDHGVDCFDRAVSLLEGYRRLYVLSRLYQQRKLSPYVLKTWKRIIEGEEDRGGELGGDGELQVRRYLSNISNQELVKKYGVWLAKRNPKLGVEVFADDKIKAPKLVPTEVVALLREEAPDAVKYYLEHLVFRKGSTAYINELITYYLDIVINDLQSSPESRATATASYEAYRALRPPKPTYRQFLTDNAPPDDEAWQSRLRLLQLLGGAHDYDAAAIRQRIDSSLAEFSSEHGASHTQKQQQQPQQKQRLLVPEAIILNGRLHDHEDSLRLLVHHLGDYDSAVSYCLRGGLSLSFNNSTAPAQQKQPPPSRETQSHLFHVLLAEFLAIEDLSDRVEQTGALLERFGGWFDVLEVLGMIPDGWSVDVVAQFLVMALRKLVEERHESLVQRALSGAENLRVGYESVVKMGEIGPTVVGGDDKKGGGGGEEEMQEMQEMEMGDMGGSSRRGVGVGSDDEFARDFFSL